MKAVWKWKEIRFLYVHVQQVVILAYSCAFNLHYSHRLISNSRRDIACDHDHHANDCILGNSRRNRVNRIFMCVFSNLNFDLFNIRIKMTINIMNRLWLSCFWKSLFSLDRFGLLKKECLVLNFVLSSSTSSVMLLFRTQFWPGFTVVWFGPS